MYQENKKVVLKFDFIIEEVNCVCYRCVDLVYWELILNVLESNPEISIGPEFGGMYGDVFDSEQLIKKIEVITDRKKVLAFLTFHGESFCNEFFSDQSGPFDQLFDVCEELFKYSHDD